MYTKNPVSGLNETLVNTSMLKGAVDGVVAKIADKADKEALDGLSVYTEGVKATIAGKADKTDVEALSDYAEGMLQKEVYGTMVDAYVGLACKVADPDVLEGAAKMAYAANPEKYATSNPSREDVAEVTDANYKKDNPIYDAIHAAGSTVELPPFLRLKAWIRNSGVGTDVTSWKTELSNLTDGSWMFYRCSGLTTWMTELPNLTNGFYMFGYCSGLTSWNIELPNLTSGSGMFYQSGLTSWDIELPNLTDGDHMFWSTGLTSWDIVLPNLTNGAAMFNGTSIEEWTVELPNLTNGASMFANGSLYDPDTPAALKRFRGTLPALVNGYCMFTNCSLDIESIRCIAESINDVNGLAEDYPVTKLLDICVGYDIESEPLHEGYVETIKNKGWTVTVNNIQQ